MPDDAEIEVKVLNEPQYTGWISRWKLMKMRMTDMQSLDPPRFGHYSESIIRSGKGDIPIKMEWKYGQVVSIQVESSAEANELLKLFGSD